jgi:DNA-binding CsgD family transcriptional regulator
MAPAVGSDTCFRQPPGDDTAIGLLHGGAMVRWSVVALVAFLIATEPPRSPAPVVAWIVLIALYSAVVPWIADVVHGRLLSRLAQVVVGLDAAAALALAAVNAVPTDGILLAFTLVLIEALLSFGAPGVVVCEGVLCVGIAAVGMYRQSLSPTGFAWRSLLTCVTLTTLIAASLLMAKRLLSRDAPEPEARPADAASGNSDQQVHISSRERQVLELVSRGWSNRVIAAHLGVSPSTIKSHMESILMRFEARNRAEAVAIASRLGLLNEPEPQVPEDQAADDAVPLPVGAAPYRFARPL